MGNEQTRVSPEQAFHKIGTLLGQINERIDRCTERLNNNDETLKAAADFIGILREAVVDLQRRAGLREVRKEQAN